MFVALNGITHLAGQHGPLREYKLVDDDFVERFIVDGRNNNVWHNILRIYEERSLPVAKNYALAAIAYGKRNQDVSQAIRNVLDVTGNNLIYSKYKAEIEETIAKLMILL